MKMLTAFSMNFSDTYFIAASHGAKEYTVKNMSIPSSRIEVVQNGVDVKALDRSVSSDFIRADDGNIIIGAAGRFSPEKGYEYLIEAAAILKQRGLPIRLCFAGNGSLRPKYEELIKKAGLEERVEFFGAVENMADFYKKLDVFVLPSIGSEGLARTLLEAMAMERCVVATTVIGTPEVIQNHQDGLLVHPRDSKALADAIGKIALDKPTRDEIGKNARSKVLSQFTIQRVAVEVENFYKKLLNAKAQ